MDRRGSLYWAASAMIRSRWTADSALAVNIQTAIRGVREGRDGRLDLRPRRWGLIGLTSTPTDGATEQIRELPNPGG